MRANKGLYDLVIIEPIIYIQQNVMDHPDTLKWVLFHELGHLLGLPHIPDGIMAESVKLGEKISDEERDELLDKYFSQLKELPPDSHMVKHWND